MTYTYRNKKSGEEILTTNKVTGKNWEPVEDKPNQQPPLEDPPVDDPMVEGDYMEETSEEESLVEEVPPEKPKTARRGKK